MYCVQISARIIRWPDICACCCRQADTSVQISSTRVTGKRVIHEQTKSWDVPYCQRCLDHVQAAKQLSQFSMFVMHWSVVLGSIGGFIAFLALLVVAGETLIPSAVILALTAVVVVASFSRCQRKYRRDKNEKEARRAELKRRLDSLLSPDCSQKGRFAAQYDGWYGTVHTFYFSNGTFADRLERANPGKCLRGGQIHH